MTENPSKTPPLVCPTCAASPIHHPLDVKGDAYYCAHRQILAVRDDARGRWLVLEGVDQAKYRQLVDRCEQDARTLAERGLTFTLERGVHDPLA